MYKRKAPTTKLTVPLVTCMLRSILLTVPNITPNVDGVKGYSKSNSNIKKKASCAQKTPHTSMKIAKKKETLKA